MLTKEQLLDKLKDCEQSSDPESAHAKADAALIEFINEPEVTEAYEKIERWYA